jgi:uncharacterized RDD family membrane protein YckC
MTTTAAVAEPRSAPSADEAGLVTRVLAFAADIVVIDVVALVVGAVVAIAVSAFPIPHHVRTVLVAVGAVAAGLWAVGYFVFFWSSSGRTPGNRLMQIRVVDASAPEPLPLRRAVARVFGAILSALLLFIGFAMIVVDRRRRGLHDLIAHSVVIYTPTGTGRRRAARP